MSDLPPRGLGTRGKRFWTSVLLAKNGVSTDERELLVEVCRTLDSAERLERLNPDGPALRQCRTLLARLLAALDLPESAVLSPVQARQRKAAQERWAKPQDAAAISEAATAAAFARWNRRREPEPSGDMTEFLERRRRHTDQYRDSSAG